MYDKLISCLERKAAFFQNQSQLVVSAAIPNFPTVNSFWVTQLRTQWKSKRRADIRSPCRIRKGIGAQTEGWFSKQNRTSSRRLFRVQSVTTYEPDPSSDDDRFRFARLPHHQIVRRGPRHHRAVAIDRREHRRGHS